MTFEDLLIAKRKKFLSVELQFDFLSNFSPTKEITPSLKKSLKTSLKERLPFEKSNSTSVESWFFYLNDNLPKPVRNQEICFRWKELL